jgi:cellulose synthase/poly-beta-1,6-N-acetylglucosamine synthase-like glycosyltransferase
MTLGDAMFVTALWGIWGMLTYWIVLSIGAVRYYYATRDEAAAVAAWEGELPFVSVLVPAHNEGLVIEDTVRALCEQRYPRDRFEIIVINDASSDDTGEIVDRLRVDYPNLIRYDVPRGQGAKGKSRTLNVGIRQARGTLIAVFDADNTPEPPCLRLLVGTLLRDPRLVAVNGKVRTRNHSANWLTRFINLEFIYFQWLFQGGRWQLMGLSMLMGTGYVIYRDAIDTLGGFDEKSLVDDTEMSLRIFKGSRRIRWVPYAVTWEQEPDEIRVWMKQRTRWTQGNLSVTWKYLPAAFTHPYPLGVEMLTFALNYILFLPALITSDLVFGLGLAKVLDVTVPGPYLYLWILAVVIYTAHMSFAVAVEDRRPLNFLLAFLSYFTYAQMFIIVLLRALYLSAKQRLTGAELRWSKTTRKKEAVP